MARTLRLVQMAEHQDFDEVQVRPEDISPGEDTTGWIYVDDGHGEKFLCSLTVVEALLWVGRPHTTEDL